MRIRYFAWIKDITNKDDDIIDINHPKTIQELKKYLENLYPGLKKHFLQDVLRFAVNQEYVSENLNLKSIDEIAKTLDIDQKKLSEITIENSRRLLGRQS